MCKSMEIKAPTYRKAIVVSHNYDILTARLVKINGKLTIPCRFFIPKEARGTEHIKQDTKVKLLLLKPISDRDDAFPELAKTEKAIILETDEEPTWTDAEIEAMRPVSRKRTTNTNTVITGNDF